MRQFRVVSLLPAAILVLVLGVPMMASAQVADQVMVLLGLDPSSRRTPQELQIETQRLQLFQQMSQRNKDVTKYLRKTENKQVFIAVSNRNNSILANAPPQEMATEMRLESEGCTQMEWMPGKS